MTDSTGIGTPAPAGRPGGPAFGGWRKSRRSEPNGACVEIGTADHGAIGVRDSTAPHGPMLSLDQPGWASLLGRIKAGALDLDRGGALADAPFNPQEIA